MLQLIMDTSNQYLMVALYEDDQCLSSLQEMGSKRQSENAIPYLQKLLEKHLKKGWTFERLSVMERAILWIAACELLESDLPKTIVINEAVVNAKKFCDDESYKFINGILGHIA